ncbi:MAG: hypothetical protein AAF483_07500 [Planctomycetota bacterium]
MYSEQERCWFAWIFVLVLVICSITYGFWAKEIIANGRQQAGGTVWLCTIIPTVGACGFFIWASWNYFVRQDEFGLHVGFTGWSTRFEYSEITKVKQVEISWVRWGGFGWRWRPGGVAYILRNGPGLELHITGSKRSYTFNCKDCPRLLAALQKADVEINLPDESP